jgi:hypothetical protein
MTYLRTYLQEICDVYADALAKYDAIQNRAESNRNDHRRTLNDRDLTFSARQKRLAKYDADHNAILGEVRDLATTTSAQFETIRKRVEEAFYRVYSVVPEDIDANTLELLKSGILKDHEFFALAERFNNNGTMRRMIGKYAAERAEREPSNVNMRGLSASLNADTTPHLDAIDTLVEIAEMGLREDRKISDNTHTNMFDKTAQTIMEQFGGICTE